MLKDDPKQGLSEAHLFYLEIMAAVQQSQRAHRTITIPEILDALGRVSGYLIAISPIADEMSRREGLSKAVRLGFVETLDRRRS